MYSWGLYCTRVCHFCSRYLDGVEIRLNRCGRNYEGTLFLQVGKDLHEKNYVELTIAEKE